MKTECKKLHTPSPEGYNSHMGWMARKSKRHDQVKCPHCGLYAVWVRRKKDDPDFGGDKYLKENYELYK